MTLEKKRKVYVIGSMHDYTNWMQSEIVDQMSKADFVVFTGGEDVDPSFYNSPAHPKTNFNVNRDRIEQRAYEHAQSLNLPCVGICRGSQFLCVMSGGSLVQHQENPLFNHDIETYDFRVLPITSTHHQAAYPYEIPSADYTVLGWTKGISRVHEDGREKELPLPMGKEAEIVHYKVSNCLGIQGHPEMMYRNNRESDTIIYLQNLLTKFLTKELY